MCQQTTTRSPLPTANSRGQDGQTGRQAGEVFHLHSSEVHQAMSVFPVPESMRSPLEHASLQCKAHCGEESFGTVLAEGLSCCLITAAMANLERLHRHTDTRPSQRHRISQHWAGG